MELASKFAKDFKVRHLDHVSAIRSRSTTGTSPVSGTFGVNAESAVGDEHAVRGRTANCPPSCSSAKLKSFSSEKPEALSSANSNSLFLSAWSVNVWGVRDGVLLVVSSGMLTRAFKGSVGAMGVKRPVKRSTCSLEAGFPICRSIGFASSGCS